MLKAVPVLALLATMGAAAQAQSYEQLERWCHDDNATDDQTIQGCSAVITSGRESGEKLARVFYDRGLAWLNKEQLGRAIEDFDEAIRLNPNFADAFSSRGDAYRLSNDPNHAIADYDKATELKPDDASAFKGRGLVFAEQSQYFYAIQEYDQAIKLDPTDPDTFIAQSETGMPPLARMTLRLRTSPRPMSSAPGNRTLSTTKVPTKPYEMARTRGPATPRWMPGNLLAAASAPI